MSFQQSSPQDIPLRPLNKGMILNVPPQVLPYEACVEAKNLMIKEIGPERRPGLDIYAAGQQCPYRPVDMVTFWASTGDQQTLLMTNKTLFQVGPFSGFSEVPWAYDEGQVSVAGDLVTGTVAVDFVDAGILPGDLVRIGDEEAVVDSVVNDTTIQITDENDLTDTVGDVDYSIQRAFNNSDIHLLDYVITDDEIIFTDFHRPLVVYKYGNPVGEQLEYFIQEDAHKIDSGNGPEDFAAGCIAVFQDRIFVGYTHEGTDGIKRQRIRWSSATNKRDFSPAENWLDLPYVQGAIRRLVVLGNTLVAYFDDAIFVGVPTNNPFLPVAFQKMETGGIGLVGMKAVMPYLDGHFFVGQDDIYLLTNRGAEKIGSPVVRRTIAESDYRERIYAAIDPENEQIVFGFTKASRYMEELWCFNYKSGGWSYWDIHSLMITNPIVNYQLSWDDLVGFSWSQPDPGDDPPIGDFFPNWDSMDLSERRRAFYIEENFYIRKLGITNTFDIGPDNEEREINMVYETGDFDLNDPDGIKTFLRMSMKVDFSVVPAEAVSFTVRGSWNRGRSWDTLGTLRIEAGFDEGYVNFIMSSPHVRFRILTNAVVSPFVISELVVKVRARGRELSVGTQTPVG